MSLNAERLNFRDWTKWNDTGRVDRYVGPIIMHLYMLEIGGRFEGVIIPIEVLEPPIDIRIPSADRAKITLEVSMIYRVEANNRRIKPNIRLSQSITKEVFLSF